MNAARGAGLAAVLAGVLVACGGSAPGASAPSKAPEESTARDAAEPEPTSVEEARDRIARAQDELGRFALGGAHAPGGGVSPPPQKDVAPTTEKTEDARAESKKGDAEPAPACRTPCRAIQSMRRAVDALCRMTGSGDDRCADAKRTLAANEARVSVCGC